MSTSTKRTLVTRNCPQCGRDFQSRTGTNSTECCSHRCADLFRKEKARKPQECIICGRGFKPEFPPSHYRRKTCSPECQSIYLSRAFSTPEQLAIRSANGKQNQGRTHPERQVTIEKVCIQCGSKYSMSGHVPKERREESRFCSHDCWYKFIRLHPDKHPSWRGGRFPYYGGDWNEKSRQARMRDNNTCQRCGKYQTEPLLDVHHIKPRRFFEFWKNANDLSNLITLCKACHKLSEPR